MEAITKYMCRHVLLGTGEYLFCVGVVPPCLGAVVTGTGQRGEGSSRRFTPQRNHGEWSRRALVFGAPLRCDLQLLVLSLLCCDIALGSMFWLL